MVGDVSSGDLKGRQQLNKMNWHPMVDHGGGVRPGRLSQSTTFLQLHHEVLGSNRATLVAIVTEFNGTSKPLRMMLSKRQISLVRKGLLNRLL